MACMGARTIDVSINPSKFRGGKLPVEAVAICTIMPIDTGPDVVK